MPNDTPPSPAALDLTRRSSFTHFAPIILRYNDLDPVGHVNNVAIAAFIEQGRVVLLNPLMERHGGGRLDTALVRITIDYRREIKFPGTADVGARILQLGTKSMRIAAAVFVGDTCHASAECVSVFFDMVERRGVEPPPALRAEMERLARA